MAGLDEYLTQEEWKEVVQNALISLDPYRAGKKHKYEGEAKEIAEAAYNKAFDWMFGIHAQWLDDEIALTLYRWGCIEWCWGDYRITANRILTEVKKRKEAKIVSAQREGAGAEKAGEDR